MKPRKRRRAAAKDISRRLMQRMLKLCILLGWEPDAKTARQQLLSFWPFGKDKPAMYAAPLVLSGAGDEPDIAFVLVTLPRGAAPAEIVEHRQLEMQTVCRRYGISLTVGELLPAKEGSIRFAGVNLSLAILQRALSAASLLEATIVIHMAQMELAELCRPETPPPSGLDVRPDQ